MAKVRFTVESVAIKHAYIEDSTIDFAGRAVRGPRQIELTTSGSVLSKLTAEQLTDLAGRSFVVELEEPVAPNAG